MTTQTDDWMAPGDDELGFGGLAKLKPVWKWALVIAALSVAALAVSTSLHQDVVRRPVSSLRSNDAVIALRLGPQHRPSLQEATNTDSWIVLLNAQGQGTVASVDSVAGGDVLWSDRGVFYGSRSRNYVTTDSGTQVSKSDNGTREEIQRYELSDGQLVTLVPKHWDYNDGDAQSDSSITTVETGGIAGDFGQCGSRILAITDTKESPSIADAAFEAYAAQSGGDGSEPEYFSVVAQLDDPAGATPRILAAAPMIPGLRSVQRLYACEADILTAPGIQVDDPVSAGKSSDAAARGTLVLQRWDLSTGERTVSPVLDGAGNAIQLNEDVNIYGDKAILVGDEYRLISRHGHAFSINLTSGQGRHLFSIPAEVGQGDMVFQVTESGVYFLTDSSREHAVTLSYHPWDGGESRVVLSTGNLEDYLRVRKLFSGGERAIESFALRPGWDGGAQ